MEDSTERANILIVDDRPDKLLAFETMLEDLNENLVCVRSGKDALRLILNQDFAVILLDVNMPVMDGFETAALIRQRLRSETTPIIFVSAVNDAETHVSRGYSLGAVDYILTPVVPEILRAKVSVFVDLFRKSETVKRQAEEHSRFVQEQAARLEAEAAQERLAFLAEAGRVLAGSLDYHQTFENLARLVVPKLADFCLIDEIDEFGKFHRVATAHGDPGKEPLLAILNYRGRDDAAHATPRVYPEKRSLLRNDIKVETADKFFAGQDSRVMKILDPTSIVVVPISARGLTVGSVTMVRTGESQPYSLADLSLAEELAQRAALALDNASLYLSAQRAREEAVAANNAKDRFLAMLSHELRTPLTPVIVSILNLEADPALPPQIRQALLVMRRNVELEARLIDDLLDLTRVGSGNIHLNREIVDAHCLLQNAVEICRPDIEAKNLSLEVELNAADIYLEADPARLQQIFWNLIRNAMKFTQSGYIRLETRTKGGRLHVQVSDSGIGITPDLIDRIFLPFEQGEKGLFGGLGLGLAITKALVDLHEGNIGVRSAGNGHGATFLLDFPVSKAPPPVVSEPPESGVPGSKPLRILLVEDHSDSNEALTQLLRLRGYTVISALNVQSALELAAVNEVDILISDLGLPDGNAGQVMQVVSNLYSARGIALTGYGMAQDLQKSRDYGFSHHFVKPVEVAKLDAIMRKLASETA